MAAPPKKKETGRILSLEKWPLSEDANGYEAHHNPLRVPLGKASFFWGWSGGIEGIPLDYHDHDHYQANPED